MKCFGHQDRDAVGECKSCGKGVCSDCAVDLGKGLACRDRCEDDVAALILLVENNTRITATTPAILRTNRQTYLWSAVFFIVMGGLFLGWGLFGEPQMLFIAIMGGVFMAYGFFTLVRVFSMAVLAPADKDRPT